MNVGSLFVYHGWPEDREKKTLLAKISFLITFLEVAIEVLAHTD